MVDMDEAKAISPAPPLSSVLRERFPPIAVVSYQVIILLILVVVPILGLSWLKVPFMGFFLDPNLIVPEIEAASPGAWNGLSQGVTADHHLIEINGVQVSSSGEVRNILASTQAGEGVEIVTQARSGIKSTFQVTLQTLPANDRLSWFYIPFAVGLIYLLTGFWVVRFRPSDSTGLAFAVLSASAALGFAGLFDLFTSHHLGPLWMFAVAAASGGLWHLAFVYPRESASMRWIVPFRWAGYLLGLLLALNSWSKLGSLINPFQLGESIGLQIDFLALTLVIFYASTVIRRLTSPSPVEQEQTRIISWGMVIAFLPFILLVINRTLSWTFLGVPWLVAVVFSGVFPLSIAYATLRYRMMDTDYIISRGLMYAALTVLVGAGYALLTSGISLLFNQAIAVTHPFLIGLMVFLLALLLDPIRTRMQYFVDAIFFQGENVYRKQVDEFADDLSQAVELSDIVKLLRQYVDRQFHPIRMHIFVYDQLIDRYVASAGESGLPTTDIRFLRNSGLVHLLSRRRATFFLDENEEFPKELRNDKPRLALLGAQLFIALPGQERLSGWMALGLQNSQARYSIQDMNFLAMLANQAAVAIERAQVLADKDRRVHEMNVLTRVAQGVNVTLDFDDILELLYAQTRQVIPAEDFNITLYNLDTSTLRHVFLVEKDERLVEKEGPMIPLGHGLEREILEIRKPIITDDYEQESRNRRVIATKSGIYAWMGVPLNAGAEIIGVIAVGSRDPAVLYTEDQYNILQAIADQAAGAIVKARLLNESELRARQLAGLNEVTRSLTSTLELDLLLESILGSAVEILNGEAGSLLLLEEETGDLVFEVVISPVAGDLLGSRLKSGVGLAGKVALEMRPLIVNNVEQDSDWYSEPDEKTGFITHGILAVPMIYKDNVIGVIEVINRKDGMPFGHDDQELLTAFAGQAAIAVENVRLYTQTDEELSSRVEELSVMQRIDRELNTSLDVSRAMGITLEWAMRQSESTAGLIGMVSDEGLHVVASEGYAQQLDEYEEGIIPLTLPVLEEVVADGSFHRSEADQLQLDKNLLDGAQSQLIMPIRRETEVIGLLLLESLEKERYDDQSTSFLMRLVDHASISIANAQLYAEVQRANIAKSDFVSFVSHELKTPMTSIKGYADLLSAGAVGEVTEPQTEFLSTIRSNIDRMATLVSDLADISRIEAGRLRLEFSPVSMSEVIDEVQRSTQRLIDEKKHTIEVEIPEGISKVWGDKNRLIQVLTNLVSNANKYTPESGRIVIRVQETDNMWDPDGAPRIVHISVVDNGIGIKMEDQKKIFTQYFRTEEGKDFAPGTGLGLNITRYLAEMQGGKIWFDSTFGQGSTFHFTVPISEEGLD
jgi:signal transduction histidine kinase